MTGSPSSIRPLRWVLAIIGLAAAIRIEALWVGFAMDDYAQLAMLAGAYPIERAPWDLFSFCDGSAAEVARLVDAGAFPWWSDPELRLSTLRPLASLLLSLDVRLFGLDARLHHLHTLVWWIAMLGIVARLLLHVLPVRWALLAFALYALDECHAQPLAWIANRNAILATTFGIAGVHAHAVWREGGPTRSRWVGVVLLAVALSCGESALAAFGFVLAYEIVRRDRVQVLWPIAVVLLGWAGLHAAGGYGASFSGIYLDPIAEPTQWIVAAALRAPILWADLAFAVPTGQLALGGRGLVVQQMLGLAALALVALWLRGASARATERDRERLRWFAIAVLLSVVPMVSAFVSARLLVMPAIAAHVIIAACVLEGVDAWGSAGSRLRIGLAVALAVAHLGLAPYWSVREIADMRRFAAAASAAAIAAPLDASVTAKRVVVLAVADPSTLLYPPLIRAAHGLPRPQRWSVLSAAGGPHRLRRVDARTLELEVEGGILGSHVEQMFRRTDRPLAANTVLAWGDAEIDIREVDAAGLPVRVRFTFATRLEDPSLVFLLATPSGFVRYPMGPAGAVMPLPPASAPL